MFDLFKNLSRYHYVVRNFVVRDLKVKYRGTVFGYLWSLLEPLSLVLIYWFVFVVIARRGGVGYPIVVILGVLHYNLMAGTVQASAQSLVGNAGLIRRVYIPREVFVFSTAASNLVVYLLSMLVVIPFLFIYEIKPGASLMLLPLVVALLMIFSIGVGLIVSCANIIYRDVGYVLRVSLRLFFYGAPVIYTVDMVPEQLRDVYLYNPIAVFISIARSAVMNRPSAISATHATAAVLATLLTFIAGAALFRRWEKRAVRFL